MILHYFDLAVRSFRRHKVLTALMILTIALGIGGSMTTATVFYVLSGDPLPGKSDRVYQVQLDAADMHGLHGHTPGQEPEWQLTRYDAEALLRAKRASRQSMMSSGSVAVEPQRAGLDPFFADARYASADFFPMFEVPFVEGGGWTEAEDETRARVAVISRELSAKLFPGDDAVGRILRVNQSELRITGVLDHWRPTPHFYDLTGGGYRELEQVFVPFSTARDLELEHSGTMNCWGNHGGQPESLHAPCAWIQFWVELDSAADAGAYRDFLASYSDEQRAAGRFERPTNVRLRNVREWLDHVGVVPSDVRLQLYLALGFLAVCLVNTVGLLLAKFLRRSAEIGVRRSLGASRRAIFVQLVIEAGTVGVAGGGLGLGLAWLGLWAVRNQPTEYAKLAELDFFMLGTTFALAVAASLLAGLLPAWRACQVTPALQLKAP